MKQIILEAEIELHPEVQLIKTYRLANQEIGRLKTNPHFAARIKMITLFHFLKHLSRIAQNKGFQIWVNENGKTGHTHTHDYRETEEELNDYDAHLLRGIELRNQIENQDG